MLLHLMQMHLRIASKDYCRLERIVAIVYGLIGSLKKNRFIDIFPRYVPNHGAFNEPRFRSYFDLSV